MKAQTEKEEFKHIPIVKQMRKEYLDLDLSKLYERSIEELSLQQSKRDQIISLYLAMFSFLIPFALSQENMSLLMKGCIFLVAGIVGVLLGLIIVRYRIYKEAYWLCCQTITVLFGLKPEVLNKDVVQSAYYETLEKKGKNFYNKKEKFSNFQYVRKNLFSAETLYFMIHTLMTCIILGLGMYLALDLTSCARLAVSVGVALATAALMLWKYFFDRIKIYRVLKDGLDEDFNHTFKIAWFLHFYT